MSHQNGGMVDEADGLGQGFTMVDAHSDVASMFQGMDLTAKWPAVVRLRAWERDLLGLAPGMRILDVGCGTGDVIAALAAAVAPGGSAHGIDFSAQMIGEAQRRHGAIDGVTYATGDATALDVEDASVDRLRSERMLQWLAEPEAAIAEFARVLRPGGIAVVLETDWRTFAVDHPEPDLARKFGEAMWAYRGDSAAIGGRLRRAMGAAGFEPLGTEVAAHAWTEWDPEAESTPSGFLPLHIVGPSLVATGVVTDDEVQRFTAGLAEDARTDRLYMTVTLVAVAGRRPA